ncbi:hypothetical protein C8R44DRAFT_865552 [Mycena epipterygia]|nr:hypothetical protein C8R44DRAFT_865552 [Mycena epipterygia]
MPASQLGYITRGFDTVIEGCAGRACVRRGWMWRVECGQIWRASPPVRDSKYQIYGNMKCRPRKHDYRLVSMQIDCYRRVGNLDLTSNPALSATPRVADRILFTQEVRNLICLASTTDIRHSRYFLFLLVNVIFIFLLVSTHLQLVYNFSAKISEKPAKALQPGRARNLFLSYVILQALGIMPLQLLNLGVTIPRFFRLFVTRTLATSRNSIPLGGSGVLRGGPRTTRSGNDSCAEPNLQDSIAAILQWELAHRESQAALGCGSAWNVGPRRLASLRIESRGARSARAKCEVLHARVRTSPQSDSDSGPPRRV